MSQTVTVRVCIPLSFKREQHINSIILDLKGAFSEKEPRYSGPILLLMFPPVVCPFTTFKDFSSEAKH